MLVAMLTIPGFTLHTTEAINNGLLRFAISLNIAVALASTSCILFEP